MKEWHCPLNPHPASPEELAQTRPMYLRDPESSEGKVLGTGGGSPSPPLSFGLAPTLHVRSLGNPNSPVDLREARPMFQGHMPVTEMGTCRDRLVPHCDQR